jgi:hypothetical protein
MLKPKRRTTMLVVDTGPEQRSRFYRLVVTPRPDDATLREELLVPDGDKLRTIHRHETTDEAA